MMFNALLRTLIIGAAIVSVATDSAARAQAQGGAPAAVGSPTFAQEELEQLAAPIALYPDSLVSQILMASTYPIEVVYAERWIRANKNLQGDALATALEQEPWDPSVKSLVNFPEVVTMMSEKLSWTTKLGDAFLAQPEGVMAAIQKLRGMAKTEGNLQTTQQQTVIVKEEAQSQVIVIESASPEVVYVPTYNPTVVYGAWPYPAYPPYYYYPPGYVAGTAAVSFGAGLAVGAAWGYAWGGCNWGHGDVDIDMNRNTFVNNKIDRSRYASNVGNRNNIQGGRGSWQHDPSHRKGASYRDQNAARKYGGTSASDAARTRDSYRGRADAGRQDLSRGGADQARRGQSPSAGTRDQPNRGGSASRPQTADRSGSRAPDRGGAQTSRSSPSQGSRGGAYDGVGQGSSARNQSQRGQASRSSPSRSSSSRPSSSSGASRGGGGGGGSRGGGGGRGGGGRR